MSLTAKSHSTGIILAGGKSRRMGEEKGLVLHQGIPFVQHIIKALENSVDTIMLVTPTPLYAQFGYPCVKDHFPDCGPVGGIYTGLYHSNSEQNVILSCDVPFITAATLQNLCQSHSAMHQLTYYENTPLVGCYHNSVLAVFENALQKKQLRLQQVLAKVSTHTIPVPETLSHTLQNINTLEEYKNAIRCN